MEAENTTPSTQEAPTSIVLISIFWILFGTFILTMTSGYLSATHHYYILLLGLLPFMIGIGFIIIGWGLLTFKKYAFYAALVFSLLGTIILLIFDSLFLSYRLLSNWYYMSFEMILGEMIPTLFFLMFVAMTGYLIKNQMYYKKKQ